MKPRFKTWSASRLDDYERCPLMAKLKHLDKLCPLCFKGRVMGGFDTPAICDSCGETITKSDALERGTAIGKTLEAYVNGKKGAKLHESIRHDKVKEIATVLRNMKPRPKCEFQMHFDRNWKYVGAEFCSATWVIVKLDVYYQDGEVGHVIDWKSGGIDKATGAVRASEKYDDQLGLYKVAVLSRYLDLPEAKARLIFTDCGPRHEPVVERAALLRKDLKKEQARWTRKVLGILSDDTFAPRANGLCRFCDFSKGKGGPCRF